MIKLKNYSSTVPSERIEILREKLEEILPEEIKARLPTIEIWGRWKDAHPSFLERIIMKLRWGWHIEKSSGETCGRRIIRLFGLAFQEDIYRTIHITLHEIGHVFDSHNETQKEREKAADAFAEQWMKNPGS